MRNETTKKFIKALAEEFELPLEAVKEIVESPYLFHVDVMKHRCVREEGIFPATRVEGMCIFHVPKWKKEKLKELTFIIKNRQDGNV